MGNLAKIRRAQGNLDAAREIYEQSIEICNTVRPKLGILFRTFLAVILSEQGDVTRARSLLDQAEQNTNGLSQIDRCVMFCNRTRVEIIAGDTDAAITALHEAESYADQLQVKPDSIIGNDIAEIQALLAEDAQSLQRR